MEFGVHYGISTNFIAKHIKQKLYAFDNFTALPDDFYIYEKDFFKIDKTKLKFEKNVEIVDGWFDRTIPQFKKQHKENIAFMNIDCDVYKSTRDIFDNLGDRIQPGTVIRFDEYWNYPFWQHHEFKAFTEFIKSSGLQFRYLSATEKWSVVVILTKT